MIKLDRIKILTRDKYVYDLNPDKIKSTRSTVPNTIMQKQPFNLFIQLKPHEGIAIIEFSAKILLDNYPQLITMNTIRQCFINICKMDYCKLDIENIIKDSELLSCDLTDDMAGIQLPTNFKPMLTKVSHI